MPGAHPTPYEVWTVKDLIALMDPAAAQFK